VRRSRGVLAYTILLLGATEALLRFSGDSGKAMLSLLSLVVLVIPLVSLLFETTYLYGARDFIELLLAQPLRRGALFRGLYLGLSLPLAAGFVVGIGLPFLWHGEVPAVAIGLTLINPVDLARVLLLLRFDAGALMGYTGAVFERFFSTAEGMIVASCALLLWSGLPLVLAARRFRVKDF